MLMLVGTGASAVSSRGSERGEGQQGSSGGKTLSQALENTSCVPRGGQGLCILPWLQE